MQSEKMKFEFAIMQKVRFRLHFPVRVFL